MLDMFQTIQLVPLLSAVFHQRIRSLLTYNTIRIQINYCSYQIRRQRSVYEKTKLRLARELKLRHLLSGFVESPMACHLMTVILRRKLC